MWFTLKRILFFSILLCSCHGYSQVKIGENPDAIDESSLLELESTDKVLVISRVTETQMQALRPLQGALVYNTDENCVYYYNGTLWNNLCNTTVGGNETLSTLVANEDGTYIYTNEVGDETVIAFEGETGGGGTVDETVTSLLKNNNDTYTYTNEAGEETLLFFDNVVDQDGNELVLGVPGAIFFAAEDGTPANDEMNLYWSEENQQLGIGTNETNATLSIAGSISTPIQFVSGGIGPSNKDHTFLINGDSEIFLPSAADSKGIIFIIKKLGIFQVTVPFGYYDSNHIESFNIPENERIVWLQSTGFTWEQIN